MSSDGGDSGNKIGESYDGIVDRLLSLEDQRNRTYREYLSALLGREKARGRIEGMREGLENGRTEVEINEVEGDVNIYPGEETEIDLPEESQPDSTGSNSGEEDSSLISRRGAIGLIGTVGLAGLYGAFPEGEDDEVGRLGEQFLEENYDVVETELGAIEEYARDLKFNNYSTRFEEIGSEIINSINRHGPEKQHRLGFSHENNLLEYGISEEILVSENLEDEEYDEILETYNSKN